MAGENNLSLLFCLPHLSNNFKHYRVIKVLFRLINNQRRPGII